MIDGTISIEHAKKAVDLYRETSQKESLRPLAEAIAEGQVAPDTAERTLLLYSKLEREGTPLDQEVISRDLEEVKRQSALNTVHEKLVEEARVAVLTGKKKATDFKILDPGDNFIREVGDVAWRVQRWGVPNLMEVGGERWKVAIHYFREIEAKMRFLVGQHYQDQ